FESGLRLNLRLVLADVGEHAVDRVTVAVAAQTFVSRNAHHAAGGDPLAGDRLEVASTLGPEGCGGLLRAGEGVETLDDPVRQHGFERVPDRRGLEIFHVVELGFAVGIVVTPGEQIDRPVVVHRSHDAVEVDGAVEEVPGDVAHQRPKEVVHRHHVAPSGPGDIGEILVTAEPELPQLEAPVAEFVRFATPHIGRGHVGHVVLLVLAGLSAVHPRSDVGLDDLRPTLDGVVSDDCLLQHDAWRFGLELVRRPRREECHMTPAGDDRPHGRPRRRVGQRDGPTDIGRRNRCRVRLGKTDRDLAVEHQDALVVVRYPPFRDSLATNDFQDVLQVLGDGHLLERFGQRGDLEDVREGITSGIVVDHLDAALLIMVEGAEARDVPGQGPPLNEVARSPAQHGYWSHAIQGSTRLSREPYRNAERPGRPPIGTAESWAITSWTSGVDGRMHRTSTTPARARLRTCCWHSSRVPKMPAWDGYPTIAKRGSSLARASASAVVRPIDSGTATASFARDGRGGGARLAAGTTRRSPGGQCLTCPATHQIRARVAGHGLRRSMGTVTSRRPASGGGKREGTSLSHAPSTIVPVSSAASASIASMSSSELVVVWPKGAIQ